MAGGSVTKIAPWEGQQKYLTQGFKQAEDLYNLNPMGTPYYGGPTVAGFDPAQEAAQGAILGYATGPRPGVMQAGTEQALMQGLAGGAGANLTGPGNPFSAMMSAAGRQALKQLTGTVLPGIREGIVYSQPGGGTRGDLLQDKAIAAASQQLVDKAAGMYGDAWSAAESRVPDYIQQSAGVQHTPLTMYGAMGDVGADRRAMTQEGINQAMARHAWAQDAPQRALQNYLASVTGDFGSVINQQNQPNLLGAGGSLIGGLLTGAFNA